MSEFVEFDALPEAVGGASREEDLRRLAAEVSKSGGDGAELLSKARRTATEELSSVLDEALKERMLEAFGEETVKELEALQKFDEEGSDVMRRGLIESKRRGIVRMPKGDPKREAMSEYRALSRIRESMSDREVWEEVEVSPHVSKFCRAVEVQVYRAQNPLWDYDYERHLSKYSASPAKDIPGLTMGEKKALYSLHDDVSESLEETLKEYSRRWGLQWVHRLSEETEGSPDLGVDELSPQEGHADEERVEVVAELLEESLRGLVEAGYDDEDPLNVSDVADRAAAYLGKGFLEGLLKSRRPDAVTSSNLYRALFAVGHTLKCLYLVENLGI